MWVNSTDSPAWVIGVSPYTPSLPLFPLEGVRGCIVTKFIKLRPKIQAFIYYSSELGIILPNLIADCPLGRKRKRHGRDMLDSIFYVLHTGCQWRHLPGDLPP
jgi:hypothetical protein